MLILNRNPGESIIIDGEIIIKVLSLINKSVRLGIEAPKHINIVRDEVLNKRLFNVKSLDNPK